MMIVNLLIWFHVDMLEIIAVYVRTFETDLISWIFEELLHYVILALELFPKHNFNTTEAINIKLH